MKDFTSLFRLQYIGVFSVIITALVFFSNISNAANYGIADSSTVKEWILKGALIVDVRTPEEFNAGNYKASINIPLAELEKNISRFGDKEKLIIVYCRSGNRSSQAKLILEKYGYKNVLNGGALADIP